MADGIRYPHEVRYQANLLQKLFAAAGKDPQQLHQYIIAGFEKLRTESSSFTILYELTEISLSIPACKDAAQAILEERRAALLRGEFEGKNLETRELLFSRFATFLQVAAS